MLVCELIRELEKWDPNDDVVVKMIGHLDDTEYNISHIGEYYDWSGKEGGSSPAIIIEE